MGPGLRPRPWRPGGVPAAEGLLGERNRGGRPCRGPQRPPLRPLLRARDVSHPRRAGAHHRLRRAHHGQEEGRGQVRQHARHGRLQQGQAPLCLRPRQADHGRHGPGNSLRGLHRRHSHARGGLHQRGGRAGHGVQAGPRQADGAPARASHHVHVRRRRRGPARRRARRALHRQDHGGVPLRGAAGRHGPHGVPGRPRRRRAAAHPRGGRAAHGLRLCEAPGGPGPLRSGPTRGGPQGHGVAPGAAQALRPPGRVRDATGRHLGP